MGSVTVAPWKARQYCGRLKSAPGSKSSAETLARTLSSGRLFTALNLPRGETYAFATSHGDVAHFVGSQLMSVRQCLPFSSFAPRGWYRCIAATHASHPHSVGPPGATYARLIFFRACSPRRCVQGSPAALSGQLATVQLPMHAFGGEYVALTRNDGVRLPSMGAHYASLAMRETGRGREKGRMSLDKKERRVQRIRKRFQFCGACTWSLGGVGVEKIAVSTRALLGTPERGFHVFHDPWVEVLSHNVV